MNNEKINLIINKAGFIFCLLTGVSLFLSEKFENNVVIPLLLLTFAVSMFFSIISRVCSYVVYNSGI